MHAFPAAGALAQGFRRVDLDTLDGQMLGQLVSSVRSASWMALSRPLLGLSGVILGGRDLLGERRRQDEVGDLAEGHLHLLRIDALALVLSAKVTLDPLELKQHQLVELAVFVALVGGSRQLRFQLRDARRCIHDVCSLIHLASNGKSETSRATTVKRAA
jgi:hypothetical protein